jgi:hypothetical protein
MHQAAVGPYAVAVAHAFSLGSWHTVATVAATSPVLRGALHCRFLPWALPWGCFVAAGCAPMHPELTASVASTSVLTVLSNLTVLPLQISSWASLWAAAMQHHECE